MAFKAPQPHRKQQSAPSDQPEEQQNELEILNPEREVTLGGKVYTVREYGHLEWLRLLYKVEPLVALVHERITAQSLVELSVEHVLLLVSEHSDTLLPVIMQAADMTREELEALDFDGLQALITTWWGVNYRFFLKLAQEREFIRIMEKAGRERAQQALAKSTPHSSQAGTGSQTLSATPGDS